MMDELDEWLEEHCGDILERELHGWSMDADNRPEDRELQAFRTWFSIDVVDMVVDLTRGRLKKRVL